MSSNKIIYLPGLNGIRAIAAMAVLVSHIALALGDFGLSYHIFGTTADGGPKGGQLAEHGVTMFFALSGFLISYLLLKEKEKGQIKIKDFYVRRILRIWPLYYVYLLLSIATLLLFGVQFSGEYVPFYIFLLANIPFILSKSITLIGHLWSIGVEEQFYLFFPHLAKSSNKKLLHYALLLIIIMFFLKCCFWLVAKYSGNTIPYLVVQVTRFHIMLIGCIGALFYYQANSLFFKISTNRITQLLTWVLFAILAMNKFNILSLVASEVVAVFTVFLIVGQVTKTNNLINLENRFFNFIGKISYGIYVIHAIVIFYAQKFLSGFFSENIFNYFVIYFLIISITIVLSFLSYNYLEKPFLKLKSKYSTVKSSNAPTS